MAEVSAEAPARLRVAFMGTPDFSVPTLKAILDAGHDVVAVYSQPPRPAGRGKKRRASPVHLLADARGIEVRTPLSLRDDQEIELFKGLEVDVAVVVAYGLILPREILRAPRLGCVNVHASLLPRWRGAAPIQRAILAGDTESGVTLMAMDEGLDTGAMLGHRSVPIAPDDTGASLHDTLAGIGAEMIVTCLARLASGEVDPEPQPDEGVTYAAKLDKEDGRIDWSLPARDVERQIRALDPWPGAWFTYDQQRYKVLSADVVSLGALTNEPGTVLHPDMTVACGADALRPTRIQRQGKAAMDVDAFLRGHAVAPGTVFR